MAICLSVTKICARMPGSEKKQTIMCMPEAEFDTSEFLATHVASQALYLNRTELSGVQLVSSADEAVLAMSS